MKLSMCTLGLFGLTALATACTVSPTEEVSSGTASAMSTRCEGSYFVNANQHVFVRESNGTVISAWNILAPHTPSGPSGGANDYSSPGTAMNVFGLQAGGDSIDDLLAPLPGTAATSDFWSMLPELGHAGLLDDGWRYVCENNEGTMFTWRAGSGCLSDKEKSRYFYAPVADRLQITETDLTAQNLQDATGKALSVTDLREAIRAHAAQAFTSFKSSLTAAAGSDDPKAKYSFLVTNQPDGARTTLKSINETDCTAPGTSWRVVVSNSINGAGAADRTGFLCVKSGTLTKSTANSGKCTGIGE